MRTNVTSKKMDRFLLTSAFCLFLTMSVSFSLMPFDILGILPGCLFWVGLLTGSAMMMVLEGRRRRLFKRYGIDRRKMQKPRCGLLTVGSNPIAVASDILMAVSVAGLVLSILISKGRAYVCYVFISATSFFLSLHCILNGRNYFHVKNQNKIRQVLEQKKVNSINKGEGDNEKS